MVKIIIFFFLNSSELLQKIGFLCPFFMSSYCVMLYERWAMGVSVIITPFSPQSILSFSLSLSLSLFLSLSLWPIYRRFRLVSRQFLSINIFCWIRIRHSLPGGNRYFGCRYTEKYRSHKLTFLKKYFFLRFYFLL